VDFVSCEPRVGAVERVELRFRQDVEIFGCVLAAADGVKDPDGFARLWPGPRRVRLPLREDAPALGHQLEEGGGVRRREDGGSIFSSWTRCVIMCARSATSRASLWIAA